jgi:hypothetical protein
VIVERRPAGQVVAQAGLGQDPFALLDLLLGGVDYYRELARQFIEEKRGRFLEELECIRREIEAVLLPAPLEAPSKIACG